MGAKLKERVRAAVGEVKERVRAAGGRALRCVATSWVPCVTLAWLWIACFPLVSVSTGELKPRSTYFDETTLVPMAARATFHADWEERVVSWGVAVQELGPCAALSRAAGERCCELARSARAVARHAVVRPRSGFVSQEAVALVALNEASFAFALAFASLCAEVDWLAKDVVVVLLEGGDEAMASWVAAYVTDADCEGRPLPLDQPFARGGLLRAAIVVDLRPGTTPHTARLESSSSRRGSAPRVLYEARLLTHGANGLLPNADFAHLFATAFVGAARLDCCAPWLGCAAAAADLRAEDHRRQREVTWTSQYARLARGLAAWTVALASGADGAHAHFLRRGVDAVTLELTATRAKKTPLLELSRAATGLELALRSLNMIEHELHHSRFMYLLAAPLGVFVSVDEFAGPLALLLLPLALTAFFELKNACDSRCAKFDSTALSLAADAAALLALPLIITGPVVLALLLRPGDTTLWSLLAVFVYAALGLASRAVFGRARRDWRAAKGALLLCAGYAHAPLVLAHPALLFFAATLATPQLVALQPLLLEEDSLMIDRNFPEPPSRLALFFKARLAFAARAARASLALAAWLATSPPILLPALRALIDHDHRGDFQHLFESARSALVDDFTLRGDAKLLYVCLVYLPVHTAAGVLLTTSSGFIHDALSH